MVLFTDPGFWSNLQKRFSRSSEPGVVSDVVDGREYKKHSNLVDEPGNIILTLNTDGVSMFRSSSVDLWPIWLAINELPPTHRYVPSILMKNMYKVTLNHY